MFERPVNINQKNFLLILYVVMLGIFGPAIYWISNSESQLPFARKADQDLPQARVSVGNQILVTAHSNSAKQLGVEAYAQGEYLNAEANFRSSLKGDRNDPEARIYLNNTIAARTESPYRIGVSVPIGGNLGAAEEILRGVAQAQSEINSNGGINGQLLVVKIANDDNDPELAREIANNFVGDPQVLAVVGHNDSNASIAAAPIYQKAEMVMITPTSSAEELSTIGDYIFRSTPSTRDLAETLAEHVVKVVGKEKIAICADSDASVSVSFKENFTWAVYNHGGKIAALDCDMAAASFMPSAIPSQAVSQGADALLVAPSVRKVDEAMKIVVANQNRLALFGNHSMNSYKTLKQGQDAADSMVLSVPWYAPQSDSSFVKDALNLWGGGVNWRTAMAYDATKTLSRAMANNTEIERETLQQALAKPEFKAQGASSEINFLPSGDRNLRGTLVKIQPGKESGTGYDFVSIEETSSYATKPNPANATKNPQPPSK